MEKSGGRPSKYEPSFNKRVYEYCLLGATDEQLATFFEVHRDTIDEWKRVHPKFAEARLKGKERADALVAKSLYGRALGYDYKEVTTEVDADGRAKDKVTTKHLPGDVQAQRYWLNNRRPKEWGEKIKVEDDRTDAQLIKEAVQEIKQDPEARAALRKQLDDEV